MTYDIILLQSLPFGGDCLWPWLLSMLGAFLLGWLLHWLLFGRKQALIDSLTRERDDYHTKYVNMEKDYSSLKYQFDEQEKDGRALKASLQSCEADKAILQHKLDKALDGDGDTEALGIVSKSADMKADPEAGADASRGSEVQAKHAFANLFPDTNLQIIEGVGPKLEQLLKEGGIANWGQLAASTPEALKAILDAAGSRYRMHDPTSWPHQAKLASEGKWEDLIKYQKFTDAGRETTGDFETDSKFEKLAAKAMGFSTNPEDLKIIEGIGPKIEGLLKDGGINNWAELAATSVERLQEILTAAGDRYRLAKPDTWPKQAELAAAGKWKELQEYQDFLQGGRE